VKWDEGGIRDVFCCKGTYLVCEKGDSRKVFFLSVLNVENPSRISYIMATNGEDDICDEPRAAE
jgi:hypothetical protein